MILNNRGEVATILTIAAFVFIGVASLTSSFFLDKPQSTSSRAQLRTAAFSGSEAPGGVCAIQGDWRVKCENKQAGCPTGEGVAMPYQCTGGKWTLTPANSVGECNVTCAITGGNTPQNPPPSTNTGGNPYGVYIDGPGRSCGPSKGGANNLGCGGDDGCRSWEVCQNGSCLDTTSNGQTQPGSNACFGDAGSKQIWTEQQIAQYNSSTNTNPTTSPNTTTGTRSCVVAGTNFTYQHGTRYCEADGDVGQCVDSRLTTWNPCDPTLPCTTVNGNVNCSTKPVTNTSPVPTQPPATTNTNGCSLLGKTYTQGQRICNGNNGVSECRNNSFQPVQDCTLGCNPTTNQCTDPKTVLSDVPAKPSSAPVQSCNFFGTDVPSGESYCHDDGKLYTCNGKVTECPSRLCSKVTKQCINKVSSGREGDLCYVEGEKTVGNTIYLPCIDNLQCKDITRDGVGVCKQRSLFSPFQGNQTTQQSNVNGCVPGSAGGIIYSIKIESANVSSYHLGPTCTGNPISQETLDSMANSTRYKLPKTTSCNNYCASQGLHQLGISSVTNRCTCDAFSNL